MPAGQMLPVERQGMDRALDLVRLSPMMARTLGRTEVIIGMIDGPVAKPKLLRVKQAESVVELGSLSVHGLNM
jgi:hypothetical protein